MKDETRFDTVKENGNIENDFIGWNMTYERHLSEWKWMKCIKYKSKELIYFEKFSNYI
jgi:hypothetical protein